MANVHNSIPVTILIGIASTFLTVIILMIIILWRKFARATLKVNFITKGGKIERINIKKKNVTTTITYDGGSYVFEEKAIISSNWKHEIFYFKGTPAPLYFKHSKNKKGKIEVSNINSSNLKAIIETELIAKLFKKEIVTIDNILLLFVLLGLGVCIFFLYNINSGVTIENSPENIEVMKNIIKQALATGV